MMILVVAEQRDGRLNRATWEAVAAAQQAGGPVKVVVVGADIDAAAAEIGAADVAEVIGLAASALAGYTSDGYVSALATLIGQEQPSHVFFAHTYQTRDFVPALAARLGGTLAGEHGDGRLRAPLLPSVWPAATLARFAAVKRAFDPDTILNPGAKVALPGARAVDRVKYDPALPPLPAAARQVLARVEGDRAYAGFRLDLLDEASGRSAGRLDSPVGGI